MTTAINNNIIKTLLVGFLKVFHKPKILVKNLEKSYFITITTLILQKRLKILV